MLLSLLLGGLVFCSASSDLGIFLSKIDLHARSAPYVGLPRMILRGGQSAADPEQSKEYLQHLKNIEDFKKAVGALDKQVAKDFPADDIIGFSHRGIPLGSVPNPDRCVVYQEPKTVDNLELQSNSLLNEEALGDAMKAIDWIESVANDMSPDRIEEKLNARGLKLEDLRPQLNSMGTRMGNLTLHEEIRSDILKQVEDIRTTHALLRHEMAKVSPVDELRKEIEEIRQENRVDPYVQLLHDWKKNKEQERESGSYMRQYQAIKKPIIPVQPVRSDPVQPQQQIPSGALRSQEENGD